MHDTDTTRILQSLGRIEQKVDSCLHSIKDHEARLRTLENRSGKRWDAGVIACIGAVCSVLMGYLFGQIF